MTCLTDGPRGRLVRIVRFARIASRGVAHDVRVAGRGAARVPFLRRLAGTVRRAWMRSDPDWHTLLLQRLTPTAEQLAVQARERHRRLQTRARLAVDGPVIYEGELVARVAFRGITLIDHPGEPDIHDWLADVLGMDAWAGDWVRARVSVELLADRLNVDDSSAERRTAVRSDVPDRQPSEDTENKEQPSEPDE